MDAIKTTPGVVAELKNKMGKHKPVLWVLASPVLKISESYTPEDLLQPIVIDFC